MKHHTQPMTRQDVNFRLHDWPEEMDLAAFNARLWGLVKDYRKELGLAYFPRFGYMPRGVQVRGFYRRIDKKWDLVLADEIKITCIEIAGVNIFHLGGTLWRSTDA